MICNDDHHHAPQTGMLSPHRANSASVVVNGDQHTMGVDGASPEGTSLDTYLHALRRNWFWCLLLGSVFAAAAGAGVFFTVKDRYTAYAELQAHSAPQQLLDEGGQRHEKFETYINSVKQLITSRRVLRTTLRNEDVKACSIVQQEDDQASWLASELSVSNPRDSEILIVRLTSENPEESATLVNAVVDTYMDEVETKLRQALSRKRDTLERIHNDLLAQEEQKREQLKNLAEQLGTVDREELSVKSQMQIEHARHVKREWINAMVQLKQANADLQMTQQRLENLTSRRIPADELEVMLALDQEGRFLTNELETLRRAVDQAGNMSNKTDGSNLSGLGGVQFRIKELERQLDKLGQTLTLKWQIEKRKELETAIQEKESLVAVLNAQVDEWKQEFSQYEAEVDSVSQKYIAVELQRKDIERLGEEIDSVAAALSRTKIQLERQGRVELISDAVPPRSADKPGRKMLTAAAGLFAFALPCVGLLFWDVRSQRVNTPDEVCDRLGLPLMGSVPILPSRVTRRLGGPSHRGRWWQALLSESIAGIRANLLHQDEVRVVMVTSAVGGEGKTTVATQLAMSLARAGKRTALIDFDLSRPSVSTVFNLDLEPGVCDILRRDCSIDEVVNDTVLPNLYVLPAGVANGASTQAMNSLELPELMNQFRERFDYVIVDGSPLVPVADARVVSRYVDGAICCVLRDVSRLCMVRRASDILDTFDVRLLGTVVTAPQESYYMSRAVKNEEAIA